MLIDLKKYDLILVSMDCWLNLYKPKGISSAKAVYFVKKHFSGCKIGHTGTLDLEAEGVLPIAIGQATKLVSILMDAKKQYSFTIQFGAKTSTGDASGEIIDQTDYFPSNEQCVNICDKFLGRIEQTPPAYSALKINGIRAYKLARANKIFEIKKRIITIYDLKLINYDAQNKRATYIADCSKGTYVRTLAEDISLSLQSLGFVIELRRTKVGIFTEKNSVNVSDLDSEAFNTIKSKCLKIETVLDDIPVLDVDELVAKKVRFGQDVSLSSGLTLGGAHKIDCPIKPGNDTLIWLRDCGKILAIGYLSNGSFKSSRVFNYYKMENNDVDTSPSKNRSD